MQQDLIFALHGFLGQASDWIPLQEQLLQATKRNIIWVTPDLFSYQSNPVTSFKHDVARLVQQYQLVFTHSNVRKKIFLGYSLGGRLGLHLLQQYSELFDHFVFISTHPGLILFEEKQLRIESDLHWKEKILNQPWNAWLSQWNAQPIFFDQQAEEPLRKQDDFDLQKLAEAMKVWSLGQQENMDLVIQKNNKKISWIVGQQDLKFLKIAQELKQKKTLLNFNKVFSGHRIVFNRPKEVFDLLQNLF